MINTVEKKSKTIEIALVGNPNSGKTTIFNALTGLRHKTANYPGVTVEKREGFFNLPISGDLISILDLPGTYSLSPRSADEEIVHNVLLGKQEGVTAPELYIVIIDACNLERSLFLTTQIIEIGKPMILALNMWDIAKKKGIYIDVERLSKLLCVPAVETIGNRKAGVRKLALLIEKELNGREKMTQKTVSPFFLPKSVERERGEIEDMIKTRFKDDFGGARGEALRLLTDHGFRNPIFKEMGNVLRNQVVSARARLSGECIDWSSIEAEKRYDYIHSICSQVITKSEDRSMPISDRLDKIFTHKFFGFLVFASVMMIMFQAIFTWAALPMSLIESLFQWFGATAARILPDGQLKSLVIDGVIAGVGSVVIFLPQIVLLFFFIALFEDSGYMARAAFVLDRVMKKVGLNGKAFIPLLSSFACAIPGVMATRTIEDKNDRLATILVAPLMSCSARLPVYTLMIAAFIPNLTLFGFLDLKAATLFSMYLLSIVAGLTIALLFRKTFLKGNRTPFVLELPPYRVPHMKSVFATMLDKAKEFLYRAGTIIFSISIILWFLASYPKNQTAEAHYQQAKIFAEQSLSGAELEDRLSELESIRSGESVRSSFAGKIGHAIEPLIEPLGFDWKIGIGLVGSFAAREVLVSTLAIVYNIGGDEGHVFNNLVNSLRNEVSPVTGRNVYTPLTAISLMVFFVLACQCMSTIAVVKRETNSWRWPLFMIVYMTALAWVGSFIVYQGGKLLGLG